MAYNQFDPADLRTAPTTSDLSGATGKAVWPDASGNLQLCAADALQVGVLMDAPVNGAAGTYLPVTAGGRVAVVAGAAIAVNAHVNVTTGGLFITSATTKPRIGVALEAAGASGDVITIELGYEGVAP